MQKVVAEVKELEQKINDWRGLTDIETVRGMYWKDRAEKAEAEVERLRKSGPKLKAIKNYISNLQKAEARIKKLERSIRLMIVGLPDGWEVPMLYPYIVAQVKKNLEVKDDQ